MSMAGKLPARKRIDRYKQVFSFAMGSRELYDFIDDNPGLLIRLTIPITPRSGEHCDVSVNIPLK